MAKTFINFRLHIENILAIQKYFKDRTEAVQYAIDSYFFLRRASLREIKGIFTKEEFIGLVQCSKGKNLTSELKADKTVYMAFLKSQNEFSRIGWKYGFSFDKLLDKIGKLSSAQIYFIQEEIWRYWKYESRKVGAIDDFIIFMI